MSNDQVSVRPRKNWADVVGLIDMIFAIINMVFAMLGFIPLLGLPLRILASICGMILLVIAIVCTIFANRKGQSVAAIVLSAIATGVALPMWIVYITTPVAAI